MSMGSTDPFANDDIDVYERDYELNSRQDILNVVRELCNEFDKFAKLTVGESGMEPWKNQATLAAEVGEWLEWEWDHVETVLHELPEIDYSDANRTHRKRVKDVFKRIRSMFEDREVETPRDMREEIYFVLEAVEEQDYRPAVKARVRREVLAYYDPSKYAQNPREIEDHERIDKSRVIHETASIFSQVYDFVYPDEKLDEWRHTLYVYDADKGIYRPRGERFVRNKAEDVLGEICDTNASNEIVAKIERKNSVDWWEMQDIEPNPYRIVVENGILDLRTLELDSHTPDEYHRTRLDVEWDEDAECPEIDSFFHDIVDDSDVETLYRILGHALVKDMPAEKAALLVGDGKNGKSTFLSLVEGFLSSRNISGRSLQELTSDRWAPADLRGSLANISGDMSEQEVEDISDFKEMTGDDSTLTAERKHEHPTRFRNTATMIFASNGVPEMPDDDMAVWRRWVYVNFPYKFDGRDKDEVPKRKLMERITAEEELQGLLRRCAEEVHRAYETDEWFPTVGRPEEVRRRMKKAADPVFAFAEDCLVEVDADEADSEADWKESKAAVRKAYKRYAREEDLPLIDEARFGERILNLYDYDIESQQSRSVGDNGLSPVYAGVQLNPRAQQLLGRDDDGTAATLDDDFGSEELPERIGGVPREDIRRYIEDNPNATPEDVRSELMIPLDALTEVERAVERWGNSLGEELAGDRDE